MGCGMLREPSRDGVAKLLIVQKMQGQSPGPLAGDCPARDREAETEPKVIACVTNCLTGCLSPRLADPRKQLF